MFVETLVQTALNETDRKGPKKEQQQNKHSPSRKLGFPMQIKRTVNKACI